MRELKNVLTKAALESRGTILLLEPVRTALAGAGPELAAEGDLRTLDEVEKEHIQKAMVHTGWNISMAAKALGLSRPTLRKRIQRYGLVRPGESEPGSPETTP